MHSVIFRFLGAEKRKKEKSGKLKFKELCRQIDILFDRDGV